MLGQRSLGGIARRHHQDASGFGRRNRGRQRPRHRPQLAGQAKLAQELVLKQRLRIDLAAGRKDAQRNRQIVAATLLGQIGRREVQGDAPLWKIEARTEQGGTHALA